ncbi:MAG: mannosyltransferase family protein [Chloroflexota bacterium]
MKIPDWLLHPLLAFTSSRIFIFFVGTYARIMLPVEQGHWNASPESPFLSLWAKWDSQYYYDIVVNGYWFTPGQQSNVAFFPFYPLLVRMVSGLLKDNVILAGFLISNIFFLGALIIFFKLTEIEIDPGSAKRVVYYLAFFPTSFFFSSVYTESTFLFFMLGTVYFAKKQNWIAASMMGILTSVTRNIGILAWPLVIFEWLRSNGWTLKQIFQKENWLSLWEGFKKHWFDLIIISIIPLGMITYMLFLKVNFDRPLAFIETQAAWGRENIGPIGVLTKSVTYMANYPIGKGWLVNFINTFGVLFFLILIPFIWFKINEGYAIFVLISLILPLSSSTGSIIRYLLTAFPGFMLLAKWGRNEIVDKILLTSFSVLLGMFVTIFAVWVFVA